MYVDTESCRPAEPEWPLWSDPINRSIINNIIKCVFEASCFLAKYLSQIRVNFFDRHNYFRLHLLLFVFFRKTLGVTSTRFKHMYIYKKT